MRLGIVVALALFATLASLPQAVAQVPDPAPVVETACAAVGAADPQARDLIPVCPRVEPAAPAPAPEEAAAPAAPAPASPQDVARLGEEVVEDVKAIPNDPASAGARLLSIVATVVQFVKDLLELPMQGSAAVGDALATAGVAVATAADATRDAAIGLVHSIKDLFDAPVREPVAKPTNPIDNVRVAPVADGLLGEVRSLVP